MSMIKNEGIKSNSLLIWLTLYQCLAWSLKSFGLKSSYGIFLLAAIWIACIFLYRLCLNFNRCNSPLVLTICSLLFFFFLPNANHGDKWLYLLFGICVLYNLTSSSDKKTISRVLQIFVVMAAVYAVYIIVCRISPDLYTSKILPRLKDVDYALTVYLLHEGYGAQIGGSAIFGDFILAAAIFIVLSYLLMEDRKDKKVMYVLAIMFFFLAVLFEGRRGEVLSIGVSFIALYFFSAKPRSSELLKRICLFVVICILAIILLNLLSGLGFLSRFTDSFDLFKEDQDELDVNKLSSGRMNMWELAWRLFLENPVYGIGLGNFRVANDINSLQNVHNTYLQFLCETGVIGLSLIVLPMVFLFFKTWRLFRYTRYVPDLDSKAKSSIFASTGIQLFFLIEHFLDPVFFRLYFYPLFVVGISLYEYAYFKVSETEEQNGALSRTCKYIRN